MGKWTDKGYITHSEWINEFGGIAERKTGKDYKRVPYDHCCLTLTKIEVPVATIYEGKNKKETTSTGYQQQAVLYDQLALLPFVAKYKKDPVTGAPIGLKDIIKLNFFKNAKGEDYCPMTFRVFNENTHIVFIRTSGNVYTYEAIEKLNFKANCWNDLMTNEPFTKKDVITIQDPLNLDAKYNYLTYFHIINGLKVNAEEEELLRKDPKYFINTNSATDRIISKISKDTASMPSSIVTTKAVKESIQKDNKKPKGSDNDYAHFSSGRVMAAFTSTILTPLTTTERALKPVNEVMYESVKASKKKAYARISTSQGDINLVLHADMVPKTVHNFIGLAKKGFYKDVTFHRLIKNFMIQGGDPTGTGSGGESFFGKPFEDEIRQSLSHEGMGILSMANRGPNTNTSQFFLTFKSCKHLDNKHTIFGKVVGGLEVLKGMENAPVDKKDRPIEPIIMKDIIIFTDPFEDYEKAKEEERLKEEQKEKDKHEEKGQWFTNPTGKPKPKAGGGVGKYIQDETMAKSSPLEDYGSETSGQPKKKLKSSSDLNDFSSW